MADDRRPQPKPPRPSFADVPEARRRMMSAVRGQGTGPELAVRRMLHAMGYRYRLHRRDLPGRPDVVLPGRRKVVMVHGCFWHQHPSLTCRAARVPRTRQEYWAPKLARNVERDRRVLAALAAAGWDIIVIWECELADAVAVAERLAAFLGAPGGRGLAAPEVPDRASGDRLHLLRGSLERGPPLPGPGVRGVVADQMQVLSRHG